MGYRAGPPPEPEAELIAVHTHMIYKLVPAGGFDFQRCNECGTVYMTRLPPGVNSFDRHMVWRCDDCRVQSRGVYR